MFINLNIFLSNCFGNKFSDSEPNSPPIDNLKINFFQNYKKSLGVVSFTYKFPENFILSTIIVELNFLSEEPSKNLLLKAIEVQTRLTLR